MTSYKKIPKFNSEAEERKFWLTHDSIDYIDWSGARKAEFPDLKPSTKVISLRLPEEMIHSLKNFAHQIDVPYQSLIKIFLNEKINEVRQYRSSLPSQSASSASSKSKISEDTAEYITARSPKKKKENLSGRPAKRSRATAPTKKKAVEKSSKKSGKKAPVRSSSKKKSSQKS